METFTQRAKRNKKMLEEMPPSFNLYGVSRAVPAPGGSKGQYVVVSLPIRAQNAAEAGKIADDAVVKLKEQYWGSMKHE